jgi:hypothetical protein
MTDRSTITNHVVGLSDVYGSGPTAATDHCDAARRRRRFGLAPNIWTFNGVFSLVDAWRERSHGRQVFKFSSNS